MNSTWLPILWVSASAMLLAGCMTSAQWHEIATPKIISSDERALSPEPSAETLSQEPDAEPVSSERAQDFDNPLPQTQEPDAEPVPAERAQDFDNPLPQTQEPVAKAVPKGPRDPQEAQAFDYPEPIARSTLDAYASAVDQAEEDPSVPVEEPQDLTSQLLGTWEVVAMDNFGEESLATQYERIYISILTDPMKFQVEFIPKEGVIEKRIESWSTKDPSLEISSYRRITTWDSWEAVIHNSDYDLDYIAFPTQKARTELAIEGTGESFENFEGWEQMASPITGLRWNPSRYLIEFIGDDTMRLFSYEQQGVYHWNRETIKTDMILHRIPSPQ
ncbi:MAG: hypothetical protein K9L73_01710 [Spirochaetia bacterium]|nr:hypothetical protein [Spirochaetia bacterium]